MRKNFNKKNILVVDDDDLVHIIVREFLKNTNSNIISAKNGYDGINTLIKEDISVVILDINMPEMNGFETLIKMKEINNNIDVIMCTGNVGYNEMVYKHGAIAYLTKPIQKEKLLNVIDMVLKLQSVE